MKDVAPTTQEWLSPLLKKEISSHDIQQIALDAGKKVHRLLLDRKEQNPKVIVENGVALGATEHALASNDGSSNYLQGGRVDYDAPFSESSEITPEELHERFLFYREKAQIDDCNIIAGGSGFASGENAGRIMVYAGMDDKLKQEQLDLSGANIQSEKGSIEHRKVLQELAAISTLDQIMKVMGAQETRGDVLDILNQAEPINAEQSELLRITEGIEHFNNEQWKKIAPLLERRLEGKKMAVGESFTCGALAQTLVSQHGISGYLGTSLNWYDPRFKVYAGASDEDVKEENIAERPTIKKATAGLLKNIASPDTMLAVGTTGWANYWIKGQPDYFSVGLARKGADQSVDSTALKANVIYTKDNERGVGRRQVTRNLGVTVALYMMARDLASHDGNFAEIEQEIGRFLQDGKNPFVEFAV